MSQQIFVSHATADDDIVTEIVAFLRAHTSQTFWVDHLHLNPPEDNWRAAIHDALQASAAGLVILSESSVQRDEVMAEWNYLLNTRRELFVLKIGEIPLTQIDYRLQLIQWIDMTTEREAALRGLAAALNGEPVQDTTPTILMRPVTGRIERKLLVIPIRGRDYGLWALTTRLKEAPTMILGIGGVGKSRTAAEVVFSSADIDSAVWLNCTATTTTAELLALMRQHLGLAAEADQHSVLQKLQQQRVLIVLDDAEQIPEGEPRDAFVALIEVLFEATAQVLLVSRTEWENLDVMKTYRPQQPGIKNAAQIVLDMAEVFDVDTNLENYATRMAKAARRHPVLIEWAVKQCKRFPPERVMSNLRSLRNKSLQKAMDDIIHKTIRQMVKAIDSKAPYEALRFLVTCQGGFTYEAATELLADFDGETRDSALDALVTWQLIRVTTPHNAIRYWVDDLVREVVDAAASSAARHYTYYRALAEQCHYDGDYATLVPEIANLEIARTFDENFADWLANIWHEILEARATRR